MDTWLRHRVLPLVALDHARFTPAEDDALDGDSQALMLAISEVIALWSREGGRSFNPDQKRIPSGHKGGGRWRSMVDRLTEALTEHLKGGGTGDPFKDFDREQLRRVAKARGLELKRGAARDDIAKALADDMKAKIPAVNAASLDSFRDRVGTGTDDELFDLYAELSRGDNLDEGRLTILGQEMDRRAGAPTVDPGRAESNRRIDDLVASGRDYRDAYAEVHDLDPDDLARQEKASLVDASRRPGETRDQTVRRLYADHVRIQYLAAEQHTRGHMLSSIARSRGVDPQTLFSGPSRRAYGWASDDLKEFWEQHPRMTYVEFRADMLGRASDRKRAASAKATKHDQTLGRPGKRRPSGTVAA